MNSIDGNKKTALSQKITCKKLNSATVAIPGSKSLTHRLLIAAALADGPGTVRNGLVAEDTLLTRMALQQLGVRITEMDSRQLRIHGLAGRFQNCADPIDLANSGTSMRLLIGVSALGQGVYTFTGTPRMCQRPVSSLLQALQQLKIDARAVNNDGCPPVEVHARPVTGGAVSIDCSISSQYLSSLLLMAPCTRQGLEISVAAGPVSKPYIDLTVAVLQTCGITLSQKGYEHFQVPGGQSYQPGDYTVEPDASNASYFWAAAAITGATVRVKDISLKSRQGDVRFVKVLESMGCRVKAEEDGIAVTGAPLRAIEVDMADMPDCVPTLAVVAAFAEGTTRICNVAHLRAKECDRLEAVATELNRMGIEAQAGSDTLTVTGGRPRPAAIHTYDDHRLAMSFAVAGLVTDGVTILDPGCVGKSFPTFWDVFLKL